MATETQLTLTNAALQEAGGRSFIASVDEASNEARAVAGVFAKTVREVLALVPWDFATTTQLLTTTLSVAAIPGSWKQAFARPDDALLVQQVFDRSTSAASAGVPIFPGGIGQNLVPGGRTAFATGQLGGVRAIFTNSTAPLLQYTQMFTDFDNWSPMAIEVLVMTLAARVAFPISGDKTLRDRLKQEQLQLEARAKVLAANEVVAVQDYPAEWMLAREIGEWDLAGSGLYVGAA